MESTAGDQIQRVEDAAHLAAPIVLAFAADPFVRWLWPRPHQFLEVFSKLTRLHGTRTSAHGGAWGRADGRSAAFWYPPGVHPDHEALGAVFEAGGSPVSPAAVFDQTAKHEPEGEYWYLRQIGVDPVLRRTGQGSAVMRPALDEADATGMAAYLEATSRAGVAFYERHGFTALAEVQVGEAPPLWPMLREPR